MYIVCVSTLEEEKTTMLGEERETVDLMIARQLSSMALVEHVPNELPRASVDGSYFEIGLPIRYRGFTSTMQPMVTSRHSRI